MTTLFLFTDLAKIYKNSGKHGGVKTLRKSMHMYISLVAPPMQTLQMSLPIILVDHSTTITLINASENTSDSLFLYDSFGSKYFSIKHDYSFCSFIAVEHIDSCLCKLHLHKAFWSG